MGGWHIPWCHGHEQKIYFWYGKRRYEISISSKEIVAGGTLGYRSIEKNERYTRAAGAEQSRTRIPTWIGENGDGVIVTPQDIVAYKNRIDL